ncbi:MarR family winged helix-turn-helix transcriptional regulator [Streptomyces sp. TLI_105]|uniref:MarR family winged helix-turn-helix transcriptional regulator n=1 Tax=Streptomyces sp. TLI_105 TaxID=1881019 RepID=UPI00089BB44D|nr:MarR family winged helix-turn-helix transcriptional regulator [Streptomyces sp. TLI_105]SEE01721.1 DNA-binding transcriptional regulator, MarR family [Streptomyces sp. TLI_105]
MTITAPTTNGRVIALAHYSARALLEGVLTRHGVTFEQSVTLRAVTVAGGSIERDALVTDVIGSLKSDASVVHGVIDELAAAKLLEQDPAQASRLRLTDAGRELYETTTAETAEISARLYAGIPAEDLAVAGRVLTLLTERANAELAGA